jgi:hypothetical protein
MSVTSVIDEEEVKSLLDATLKAIQTEADPYLLNQYRALIRKNVSFFKRSYLAAYLLMLREQSQGRPRKSGGDRPRGRPNARNYAGATGAEPGGGAEPARRSQRPAPQNLAPVALPEEESTQLFINIGRSRWVFPREILGLIGAKTSIPREDIGLITILNNYSFIQVRNSAAAEMLEALNGVNFRGKTLAVNYARTRKEGGEKGDEPALKPPEQDEPHAAGGFGTAGSETAGTGSYGDAGNSVEADDPADSDDSGEAST